MEQNITLNYYLSQAGIDEIFLETGECVSSWRKLTVHGTALTRADREILLRHREAYEAGASYSLHESVAHDITVDEWFALVVTQLEEKEREKAERKQWVTDKEEYARLAYAYRELLDSAVSVSEVLASAPPPRAQELAGRHPGACWASPSLDKLKEYRIEQLESIAAHHAREKEELETVDRKKRQAANWIEKHGSPYLRRLYATTQEVGGPSWDWERVYAVEWQRKHAPEWTLVRSESKYSACDLPTPKAFDLLDQARNLDIGPAVIQEERLDDVNDPEDPYRAVQCVIIDSPVGQLVKGVA